MNRNLVKQCARVGTAIAIVIFIIYKSQPSNYILQTLQTSRDNSMKFHDSKHMVIVIVVCPPSKYFVPRDEATVLLKSIIISAKLNNISIIKLYFFVEDILREKVYFRNKIHVSIVLFILGQTSNCGNY